MTNWHIRDHPFRQFDEEMIDKSHGDAQPAPVIKFNARLSDWD
jgi:hypothetical protein